MAMVVYIVRESRREHGNAYPVERTVGVFDNKPSAVSCGRRRERTSTGHAEEWCWVEEWEVRS